MYEQINLVIAYLHSMWRYRWSALLVSWIVLIVGCLGVYALPDKFESTATVNIDTASIMKPLLNGLAVESDQTAELTLVAQVLLSRGTLLTVAQEAGLSHGDETPEELELIIRKLGKSINIEKVRAGRDVRRDEPFSATYQIAYKATSPELAYKVTSALVATMRESFLNSGRTDTIMAQDFLDKQIREYEAKLEADEKRLADFKKKNITFMVDEQGGYYEQLRNSETEVEKTKSALRDAKQRYSELRTQLSAQSPMLSSVTNTGVQGNSLQQYKARLAELLTRFTDNHPDVQALRSIIANLEEGGASDKNVASGVEYNPVYQELKVQESAARIEVGRLQINLAEQQQALEKLQQSVDIIPQVEADLAKLNRDYEITKERYLALVQRKESARLAQQVEQSNSTIDVRVIEPPIVPILPSWPNRMLFLLGVFVAALAAGVGWSLLKYLLYPAFIDSKQVRNLLGLPVLGSVMLYLGTEQKRSRKLKLANFIASSLLLLVAFGGAMFFVDQGSEFIQSLLT